MKLFLKIFYKISKKKIFTKEKEQEGQEKEKEGK